MAKCKKCDGQGVVTELTQRGGYHAKDGMIGLAIMTLGVSLLLTTTTKEVTCPRCYGLGRVGYKENGHG
jgi:DnaJ-class molecular chaperone